MNYLNIVKKEKPSEGLEDYAKGFLKDRLSEYQKLVTALEELNFQGIKELAHNWKGFCAPYGFKFLGETSGKLEKAAVKKDTKECSTLISQINDYLMVKKDHC